MPQHLLSTYRMHWILCIHSLFNTMLQPGRPYDSHYSHEKGLYPGQTPIFAQLHWPEVGTNFYNQSHQQFFDPCCGKSSFVLGKMI